jgi:hypothetical protein
MGVLLVAEFSFAPNFILPYLTVGESVSPNLQTLLSSIFNLGPFVAVPHRLDSRHDDLLLFSLRASLIYLFGHLLLSHPTSAA